MLLASDLTPFLFQVRQITRREGNASWCHSPRACVRVNDPQRPSAAAFPQVSTGCPDR